MKFYETQTLVNNPLVELPSKESVNRYQPIVATSEDKTIQEMRKYIGVVEDIREKLLMIVYNYIYDTYMTRVQICENSENVWARPLLLISIN